VPKQIILSFIVPRGLYIRKKEKNGAMMLKTPVLYKNCTVEELG